MDKDQSSWQNIVEGKFIDTDDPIAAKLDWSPAKSGGTNFKSQKMSMIDNKIIIERSVYAVLFSYAFIVPGFGAFFVGVPLCIIYSHIVVAIFFAVWGAVFGGAGLLLYLDSAKVTFDKFSRTYDIKSVFSKKKDNNRHRKGRLVDIYAIQLLSENIKTSKSSFTSYEMNLVFKDGSRVNVMDHGNREDLEQSAKQLAEYINVPIWRVPY